MAIQNEPTRISTPFADAGTKNVIPETMPQPSATAAASWQTGFPTVCSLPLSAGGIPPARNDFNGLLNQMTQTERFLQDGGIFTWDASTDYGTNRLVLGSDGKLYWSVAQSGPNTGAGAVNPTTDSGTYWGQLPVTATEAAEASYSSVAGGFVSWSNTIDYAVSQVVLGSDGLVYMAKAASGPNAGGAQDPTADSSHIYWAAPSVPLMALTDSSSHIASTDWVNQWKATQVLPASLYVDIANGDDSNPGTSSLPLKTIAKAHSILSRVDMFKPNACMIYIGAGDYTGDQGLVGVSNVSIHYICSSCIVNNISPSGQDKVIYIGGEITVGQGGLLIPTRSAQVLLRNGLKITFTGKNLPGIFGATNNALLATAANFYTIDFIFDDCLSTDGTMYVVSGGAVELAASTINFSGTASGPRYNVQLMSLAIGFGSPTAIPGTSNGFVDSSSVYS